MLRVRQVRMLAALRSGTRVAPAALVAPQQRTIARGSE
jgi:hypothetical protein